MRFFISAWIALVAASQHAAAWDDQASSKTKQASTQDSTAKQMKAPVRSVTLPRPADLDSKSGDLEAEVAALNASPTADTGPVFATFRSEPIKPKGEVFTVLGNRDDSLESTYVLEGRGKEIGAGRRYGRYCEPGMERAGYPYCVRAVAHPSPDCYHSLGYVGGGTPFRFWGERRYIHEGTVGLDYTGRFFSRKTWLLWSHGGLYQGGAGRYETDGPRILPEKE
jgi:hypothetical protein